MTLLELLEKITQAPPSERFALADNLIDLLSEDEKILAAGYIGEFILSLDIDNA
jgi:hypothetical protein